MVRVGGITSAAQVRSAEIAELLVHSGTVEVSDDIRSSKWMKLVANAAETGAVGDLGLPLAEAAAVPGMREFMTEAGREAVRTAIATGNRVSPDLWNAGCRPRHPRALRRAALQRRADPLHARGHQTTVCRTGSRTGRSEVDQINGLVVDEQARLGGSAPANRRTVERAHRIELWRIGRRRR